MQDYNLLGGVGAGGSIYSDEAMSTRNARRETEGGVLGNVNKGEKVGKWGWVGVGGVREYKVPLRSEVYEVSNIRGVKLAATVDLVMQGSCQFRGVDHESGNY